MRSLHSQTSKTISCCGSSWQSRSFRRVTCWNRALAPRWDSVRYTGTSPPPPGPRRETTMYWSPTRLNLDAFVTSLVASRIRTVSARPPLALSSSQKTLK